jgi:hypothetical protein
LGKKGSNDVGVLGGDDKRPITPCVSSCVDGALLPLHSFFKGQLREFYPFLMEFE